MSNTKITQHVIADDAITTSMITDANITPAKLHGTLDLSSKTLTIPAVAIPSASTATTQSASDNSTKVATTAYVETAISNLVDSSPSSLNTLNELAAALNDDASFSSTVTASIATKLPLAGGTMTGDLVLGDNVKLEVGSASGGDLQIYHDGSNSFIQDAGTGQIRILGDDVRIYNAAGNKIGAQFIQDGEARLKHNNTTMLATKDYGVDAQGTGALKIPVGTTGQRPTAATGQMRWNTTDGALEVYNGSAWTAVGTGSSNKVLDTFTGDNSTTDFTLSVTPANEDALIVFIDGVYQEKGDYTLTNAVLALDTAPASGEKIAVHITTASVHDGTSAVNQQFTATAGQTAFTLSADPKSENNTQVYINGVYQQKSDYTVSGTTLTFDTGLTVGDVVEVNSFTVTTLGNTDTVSEGTTNLYHTTARARSAISVSGNALSYNSSTGVITSAYEESPTFTGTVTSAGLAVDTDTLIVDASNNRVGIGTTSPNQSLELKTTSGTTGLRIHADHTSAPRTALEFMRGTTDTFGGDAYTDWKIGHVGNDQADFAIISSDTTRGTNERVTIDYVTGNVGIGINGPLDALHVLSPVSTAYRGNLLLNDNTSMAAGVGGQINFGGKFTSSGTYTEWAGIQGAKENATDNNFGGQLEFRTRANTAALETKMTIASSGDITMSSTGSLKIPAGTTAQRPTGVVGMIRYNTTLSVLEEYDGSNWKAFSSSFTATGGTISSSGGYTYHTFTSSGTFSVTSGAKSISYLIVAGGGGGGYNAGAGGGAGGYRTGTATVDAGTGGYTITIGAGGAGSTSEDGAADSGSNSSAFGITSTGGGGGTTSAGNGANGGSGGGGAASGTGGSGTSGQGNDGGDGNGNDGASRSGAGGGGAGAVGQDTPANNQGGSGGAGSQWSNGTTYAGGGGGSPHGGSGGSGGSGGGGAGGTGGSSDGTAGTANTGGGGGSGGGYNYDGANGGSGIVIIRYS